MKLVVIVQTEIPELLGNHVLRQNICVSKIFTKVWMGRPGVTPGIARSDHRWCQNAVIIKVVIGDRLEIGRVLHINWHDYVLQNIPDIMITHMLSDELELKLEITNIFEGTVILGLDLEVIKG